MTLNSSQKMFTKQREHNDEALLNMIKFYMPPCICKLNQKNNIVKMSRIFYIEIDIL